MTSSRLSLIIIIAVLGLTAALAVAAMVAAPARCAKQLYHLGAVIIQYHLDHGSYPASWAQLAELPHAITQCPDGGGAPYDFLDLSRVAPSAAGNFPLLVDPTLANHGSGIYILFSDSHVEWDPARTSLSAFLARHPEVPYQPR